MSNGAVRKRVLCCHNNTYGSVKSPCHKVLFDVEASEIKEEAGVVIATDAEKITIKCSGCRRKTIIMINNNKEDKKDA